MPLTRFGSLQNRPDRVVSRQAGPCRWSHPLLDSFLGFSATVPWVLAGIVLWAVTAAGRLDDVGVVEEAVQDRGGVRDGCPDEPLRDLSP